MKNINILSVGALLFLGLLIHSCILDEFRLDDIRLADEWEMDVISPLFKGSFEFNELIYDKVPDTSPVTEQTVELVFPGQEIIEIPGDLIFQQATIIDSFEFFINGSYSFTSVDMEYRVSNGSPLALNFQMRFFNNHDSDPGAVLLPDPFLPAQKENNRLVATESEQIISLSDTQLEKFKSSNKIEFSTWFERPGSGNLQSSFLSDYPIEILIILHGKVKGKDEK